MQNVQLLPKEEEELLKILSFLEDSHTVKKKALIDNIKAELSLTASNIVPYIQVIIKGLSISVVKNFEISLELHKSLLIHLKNLLIINQRYINDSDLYECVYNICNIMLTVANNEHNQCDSMVILFENLIKTICDNNTMMNINKYKEGLFKNILDKVNSANDKDFLIVSKNSLILFHCFLCSNYFNKDNYLDYLLKYFIPLIDNIFKKVHLFINPAQNILEIKFIFILRKLYNSFYSILLKLKKYYSSLKRKEVADEIFKLYGKYTYELMQTVSYYDEETKNKFGDSNPIIVFNENYMEINFMKAYAFRFISLLIKYSKMASNDDEKKKDITFDEKNNSINNDEIINITSKLITLVIKSFENILNNETKFYFLRKIDDETSDEENCYNILLYNMTLFLAESLTINEIKNEFNQHMKLFLLNVIFPLLISVESEFKYMRSIPEEYCAYFNDLIYNFTLPNFRISGFFLIKKICENYEDIPNFIYSYIIEMFDDIINKDQIHINNNNLYSIYQYYKSQNVLFDKLNENIKLDFCVLIIIILQEKVLSYDILKNKLKEVLIKAQDKFDKIRDPLIKIKLCHLFRFAIPNLFTEKINQKENENYIDDDNNNGDIINIDTDMELNEINSTFVNKALNYLFDNLTQSKSKDSSNQYIYYHSLGNEASEIIIYFTKLTEKKNNENLLLKNTLVNSFQKYFHNLIDIIDVTELYSLFNVIEQIIKDVKINDREELFNCLSKLTKRFIIENDTGDINSQIYCPLYFSILSSFFNGVNKIDITNNNYRKELAKFDDIFKPALDLMSDIYKFLYYENLVKAMIDYVKNFQGINESSVIVLNSMFNIIDNERTFSLASYSFISTFLYYLQNKISEKYIDENKLFTDIVKIMDNCFEIDFDEHDYSNLYSLLLALQIYSKNMIIIDDVAKNLLAKSLKCFAYIFERDKKDGIEQEKKQKDIIIFGILALGYIFKPEQTHSLLNQIEIIQKREKVGMYDEIDNEPFSFEKYIEILSYINEFEVKNELLRKCMILGFCSIMKMVQLNEYFNNNKTTKIKLIKIFVDFILMHKEEEVKNRNKLMKNQLNDNMIKTNDDGKKDLESDEFELGEEEEENEDQVDKSITYVLESNENIKNSDEYLYFKNTLDYIKQNDKECIDILNKELTQEKIQQLENIYHIKKYKINYQGKEMEIPRRIINIKRNVI